MTTGRRHHPRAARWAALVLLAAAGALPLGDLATALADAAVAASEKLELVTGQGVLALDVEIADTPAKQALGLMYRTSLADTSGMLFVHDAPREVTMWMRNTYIPLDMVFIGADGTIHRIEAMTEPHSEEIIASKGAVTAVLELAGGAAARLGLKPGDKVRHRHFGAP